MHLKGTKKRGLTQEGLSDFMDNSNVLLYLFVNSASVVDACKVPTYLTKFLKMMSYLGSPWSHDFLTMAWGRGFWIILLNGTRRCEAKHNHIHECSKSVWHCKWLGTGRWACPCTHIMEAGFVWTKLGAMKSMCSKFFATCKRQSLHGARWITYMCVLNAYASSHWALEWGKCVHAHVETPDFTLMFVCV